MVDSGFETYDESGRIQFSNRFVNMRLVNKQTLPTNIVYHPGSPEVPVQSQIVFSYSGPVNPMVAFRAGVKTLYVEGVSIFSGALQASVVVFAPVGAEVTMYVFDNTPPTPGITGDCRLELYRDDETLTFSLTMKPARIVTKISGPVISPDLGWIDTFNGDPNRLYATCAPFGYRRTTVQDSGSDEPDRYRLRSYPLSHMINDATGVVTAKDTDINRYTTQATAPPSGSTTTGQKLIFVLDVTNY